MTGFQCRPQEEHFYLRLCYSPYKHKSYGIIQFFSMVGVLGSPSMPQEYAPSHRRSSTRKICQKKFLSYYLDFAALPRAFEEQAQ